MDVTEEDALARAVREDDAGALAALLRADVGAVGEEGSARKG